MESATSKNLEIYLKSKIRATEELINLTKQKLNVQVPKLWQVKQMQMYYKNLKDVKNKLEHLEWLLDELCLIPENEAANN